MVKSNIELYKETGKDCYREAVIKEYAYTVKVIAGQLYAKNSMYLLDKSDYENYGILGLIDAIDRYDLTIGVQFDTYASHRIRGTILDELRKFDPLQRSVRDNQKRYRQYENVALQTFGPDYTREQLMKVNKISDTELERLERDAALDVAVSLDGLLHSNHTEDDVTLDIHDETRADEGERLVLQKNLASIIDDVLNMLTEKERLVITMIYYEDMTQLEIATTLGITDSRVSQLHRKALIKMGKDERLKQWQAV